MYYFLIFLFLTKRNFAKIAGNEWNDCLEELREQEQSEKKHWWKRDFSEGPSFIKFWVLNPESLFIYSKRKIIYKRTKQKEKAKNQMESIKLNTYQVGKIITQKWVVLSDIWT